jgi:predicted outer membrane protein
MTASRGAYFDEAAGAIVVNHLLVRDKDVNREACRWTSGERGPAVDNPELLAAADLSEFIAEAVKIGAHALAATGQAQDSRALERMLKEVGEKASESTVKAAEQTERVVKAATDTVVRAAADAKKAIVESDEASRSEFVKAVGAAKTELNSAVRSLLGGDQPELLERLEPLLDKFGTTLDMRSKASIADVVASAVKQFDPADPTSPMAKHNAEFEARQKQLTDQIGKNHDFVVQRINDISTTLKIQDARATLSAVTPIKGETFEAEVFAALSTIATGLGDEYTDTSTTVGAVSRSKKGDGLLHVDGGVTRVVVEITDSVRTGWGSYLDEAERNRRACASLGLVRSPEQNGGHTVRTLGARRIVLAFDPTVDDHDLLRTVIMLLRAAALSATSRRGDDRIDTAEEKLAEAIAQLDKLDEIKKAAGSIHKSADKVETGCTAVRSGIERLLADALAALADAKDGDASPTQTDAVA